MYLVIHINVIFIQMDKSWKEKSFFFHEFGWKLDNIYSIQRKHIRVSHTKHTYFARKPSYVSYKTALSDWNLDNQMVMRFDSQKNRINKTKWQVFILSVMNAVLWTCTDAFEIQFPENPRFTYLNERFEETRTKGIIQILWK